MRRPPRRAHSERPRTRLRTLPLRDRSGLRGRNGWYRPAELAAGRPGGSQPGPADPAPPPVVPDPAPGNTTRCPATSPNRFPSVSARAAKDAEISTSLSASSPSGSPARSRQIQSVSEASRSYSRTTGEERRADVAPVDVLGIVSHAIGVQSAVVTPSTRRTGQGQAAGSVPSSARERRPHHAIMAGPDDELSGEFDVPFLDEQSERERGTDGERDPAGRGLVARSGESTFRWTRPSRLCERRTPAPRGRPP